MAAEPGSEADLETLIQRMQHLKQEHRELLELISMDGGMSVTTRKALLAHLMEEEDELVAQMARAAPAATAGNPLAAAGVAPRLTVGSLRRDSTERGVTLGSLRRG